MGRGVMCSFRICVGCVVGLLLEHVYINRINPLFVTRFGGGGRKNVRVHYFFACPPLPSVLVKSLKNWEGWEKNQQVLRTYFEDTGKTSKCIITF